MVWGSNKLLQFGFENSIRLNELKRKIACHFFIKKFRVKMKM